MGNIGGFTSSIFFFQTYFFGVYAKLNVNDSKEISCLKILIIEILHYPALILEILS